MRTRGRRTLLIPLTLVAAVVAAGMSASAGQARPARYDGCVPTVLWKCGVPIKIKSPATLNAVVGKAYSFQFRATGGMSNGYVYSVKSGSRLPPGISLNRNGLLYGKATKAGEWSFAICARDKVWRRKGAANYVYSSCSSSTNLTVAPPPNPYPFDGNYEYSASATATATCPDYTYSTNAGRQGQFKVWHGIVNELATIAVSGSTGTATQNVSNSGITVSETINFTLGPGNTVAVTGTDSGGGTVGLCAVVVTGTIIGTRVSP